MKRPLSSITITLLLLNSLGPMARAAWTVTDGENTDQPGRKVDIQLDDQLVARFIYGEGQMKPFLHVFGDEGDCLTEWSAKQVYPHHRGIFIGWNKITSDLGSWDLWHLTRGAKMRVVKLEKLSGGPDAATLVARIEWLAGQKDTAGSDLLITETRTLVFSRPEGKRTQVDVQFELKAARDLELGGDLQHAGIHFRGSQELVKRAKETSYVWEPDLPGPGGRAVSKDFKWCRLLFPIGERWYSSTELNTPGNPIEELSWRDYGRFGFFFKKRLKAGEAFKVNYRFVTQRAEAPAGKPKPSAQQVQQSRAECQALYEAYVQSLK